MQESKCLLSRRSCLDLDGPCKDHGKEIDNNNKQ